MQQFEPGPEWARLNDDDADQSPNDWCNNFTAASHVQHNIIPGCYKYYIE